MSFGNLRILALAAGLLGMTAAPGQATPLANVALGGTASQSSTWQGNSARNGAQKAIDGNTNGVWVFNNSNTLTHTNADTNAWWQVDLGNIYNIDHIIVWNRTNCCTDRMNDFNVLIDGNLVGSWHQVNGPAPSTSFNNLNTNGQVVRIQLTDTNYLHLAEVQVFASAASDVPEPASLAIMVLGLLGIAGARRRK